VSFAPTSSTYAWTPASGVSPPYSLVNSGPAWAAMARSHSQLWSMKLRLPVAGFVEQPMSPETTSIANPNTITRSGIAMSESS
jgi:hypothetical protein